MQAKSTLVSESAGQAAAIPAQPPISVAAAGVHSTAGTAIEKQSSGGGDDDSEAVAEGKAAVKQLRWGMCD